MRRMKLNAYLAEQGLTRAAFAERIGVSAVQVSRLCTGANLPSLVLAARIHDVTGGRVSLADWIDPSRGASEEAAGAGEAA